MFYDHDTIEGGKENLSLIDHTQYPMTLDPTIILFLNKYSIEKMNKSINE
jgi:hypothetical protein